jgi:hypothetical protein
LVRVGSRDVWGWGSLNLVRPLAIKLTIEAKIVQFEKRSSLFFIVQKKGKTTNVSDHDFPNLTSPLKQAGSTGTPGDPRDLEECRGTNNSMILPSFPEFGE